MPKSKIQKQQEALERKRTDIPAMRNCWQKAQPGGEWYKLTLADRVFRTAERAREEADMTAKNWDMRFKKACAEAQVDTHGNPLKD
jgi:hypothetical protein